MSQKVNQLVRILRLLQLLNSVFLVQYQRRSWSLGGPDLARSARRRTVCAQVVVNLPIR
jgi:hypothetical protein